VADTQDVSADDAWDLLGSGDATEAEDAEGTAPVDDRPRRSYKFLFIGAGVALLLVLLIGVGPTGWRILQQKDARIDTPATVAGLTLDTSASAATTTDNLRTALSAGVDLDNTVAAVYTEGGAAPRSVIFFGGTGLVWSPGKELGTLFDLLSDSTGGVEQVKQVAAGSLGGVMRCGVTPFEDGVIPVCGWADHGSVAVALFLDRAVDEAGSLMSKMRGAMERRA
jgi:hypothetical protein